MSARDAIPEFETTKAAKKELTFADALAKLTAVAEEGWAPAVDQHRSAKASFVLAHYFLDAARYRDAVHALRTNQDSDVKRSAKMHRSAENASKEFLFSRDSVLTFFVDEAYKKREGKLQARVDAGEFVGDKYAEYHKLSEESFNRLERAKAKVLSAHGVFKLT